MASLLSYVLITPARNEAQFIGSTIEAVVAQTARPLKWVIVSDGSVDATDDIVARYVRDHAWIELIRMPPRRDRHFAGKVHAFNAGYAAVAGLDFEIIGNLDADVTFPPGHFRGLVQQFANNPLLGVAGAPFKEGSFQYDYRFSNIENVWGGCQLFRRRCFEEIGGYLPLKRGCIDHVAVVSARMKGWTTRTFSDSVCLHHRVMGTAQQGGLKARFHTGIKDYTVGNHPVWELFRAAYQMTQPPLVFGGLALLSGYASASVQGAPVPVSEELVEFTRREQMQRLRRFLRVGKTPSPEQPAPSQTVTASK